LRFLFRFDQTKASFALVLLCLFICGTEAEAASCCGGGFSSPSIITGDERATLSSELSYATVTTEVSSGGIWQTRSSPESLESLKLQGAHIFSDRFQIGASLPVIRRTRAASSSSGIGDTAFNLGFEVLPEWEFSEWRPRGVSYLTLVIPTGRSIQDASESLQLDARGRGFWSLGLGTTLTKVLGTFDLVSAIEGHKSFAKSVSTAESQSELTPGFGGSLLVGAGFNFKDARIGASLTANYEDAVETRGPIASSGAPSRFATFTLSASRMLGDDWAAAVAYSDQHLFGAPINTSLLEGFSLSVQRRFAR
jgi:hypothetical protein